MSHVRMRGLSKSFGSVHAVHELNLDIERGELLAVLGPSGCGKTTLRDLRVDGTGGVQGGSRGAKEDARIAERVPREGTIAA